MIKLLRFAALVAVAVGMAAVNRAAEKPNVVVIISDDAGWADYGFMRNATAAADPGNRGAVPTPNLDQLASAGSRSPMPIRARYAVPRGR